MHLCKEHAKNLNKHEIHQWDLHNWAKALQISRLLIAWGAAAEISHRQRMSLFQIHTETPQYSAMTLALDVFEGLWHCVWTVQITSWLKSHWELLLLRDLADIGMMTQACNNLPPTGISWQDAASRLQEKIKRSCKHGAKLLISKKTACITLTWFIWSVLNRC